MSEGQKGPLLIKGANASVESGKEKGKWSETMERAGSKHVMECPSCCANRLFQIERNSRRLNRATWNISSCSFSLLPIEKARGGGEKRTTGPPSFDAAQVALVHLQSIAGIELRLNVVWSGKNANVLCICAILDEENECVFQDFSPAA